MPYRIAAKPREPQSPDVDVNLLAKPWSSWALLMSLLYLPFLTWWVVMVEGGSGPRQVSLTAKIAIAVAYAVWLVVLLFIRARHQRVLKAAVARMEQEAEASTQMRIPEEPSRTRVAEDILDVEGEHESSAEPRQRSIHGK